MAGKKTTELPVTKSGYQFQSEAELKEAKWLISEGDFTDLDDFGESMQRMLKSLRRKSNTITKPTKKAA